MPVEYGSESNYAKEMRRWEAYHGPFGPPGRQFVQQTYPQMMYRAERVDGVIKMVEHHLAGNDDEQRNFESRGFHVGPQAAHDAIARQQTEHGILAAEREFQIQHNRLSEKAVAEVRAAEQAHGSTHLPDVPETPIRKKRKYTRKVV